MEIKGIKGMSIAQIQDDVANGGKFVVFTYCFSIVVMSFRRQSPVYFIRSGESAFVKGLPFMLISLLFGWWGIPWGVFYTLGCLFTDIGGGKNVTDKAMKTFHRQTRGHVFEFETAEAFAI